MTNNTAFFAAAVDKCRIGNYPEAILDFEQILEMDAFHLEALWATSNTHLAMGEHLQALSYLERLLVMRPCDANYLSQKGILLFHLDRKEDALFAFNVAQNLEPENPYRYSSRAYIKSALGDLWGAIEDYKKAIYLDPNDAIAHNNLGLLEEKLGYQDLAKQRFERADELDKKLHYDAPQAASSEFFQAEGEKAATENNLYPSSQKREQKDKKSVQTKNLVEIPSRWEIVKKVFTSKTMFMEFVSFLKKR